MIPQTDILRTMLRKLSWAILPIIAFIAFGGSLAHDFAPIDDHFLILQNLAIRGVTFENLRTIFTSYDPELYIPLTLFTYQLNYLAGGLEPFGYHLVNATLHAANGVLVFFVVQAFVNADRRSTELTANNRRPYDAWTALLAASLFTVHPIHTQSVVWIAGRKDLLMTMFFLLSFLAFVRNRQWWSLGFFLLACLSKVTAITLPAVLILHEAITHKSVNLKNKTPFFIISILFILIAFGGKERIVGNADWISTVLFAGRGAVLGLQKLVLPTGLSIFYPAAQNANLLSPALLISSLIMILLIFFMWFGRRKWQWLSIGLAVYIITIAPALINLKTGGQQYIFADRYAYLPSVGIFFILAYLLAKIPLKASMITAVILLSTLTMLTIRQVTTWSTPEKLFSHALGLYPASVPARTALAKAYREAGKYEEAFSILKEGLRYGDDVRLFLGAGAVYARVGQTKDAAEQFGKARAIAPDNPEPSFALGSLEEQLGNVIAAQAHYERAVELDPSYAAVRAALGKIYLNQERGADARAQFAEALRWNPNSREAHEGMVNMFEAEGDGVAATEHRRKADALRL